MKSHSHPQPVYYSLMPRNVPIPHVVYPCDTCTETVLGGNAMCDDRCPDGPPVPYYVCPPDDPWHYFGVEGVAPSYAVAARTCSTYLRLVRETYPFVRFTLHVEPYDFEVEP